jgi:hypothetical protein
MKKKHVTWGHGSMKLLSNKYLEMKKQDLRSWEYESVIKSKYLEMKKDMWLEVMGVWMLSNKYLEMRKKNMTWGHGSVNLLSN